MKYGASNTTKASQTEGFILRRQTFSFEIPAKNHATKRATVWFRFKNPFQPAVIFQTIWRKTRSVFFLIRTTLWTKLWWRKKLEPAIKPKARQLMNFQFTFLPFYAKLGSEKSWVCVLSGSIWLFPSKASRYSERLYELKSALIWLILVSIDRAMAELQNLNFKT